MKNNLVQKIGIMLLIMSLIPTTLFAHSGRTDRNGGHRDTSNRSGLGSYHYHCGGNPPHLHSNGCPYNNSISQFNSSYSSKSNKTSSKKVTKPRYKTTVGKFNIDGQYLEIPGIIDNEMILVEMRPLCDILGITINWDNNSSTAYCTNANTSFSLTIGSKSAKLNGIPTALDRSPKLINGKTLLPARFVAESIGKVVEYNSSTGVITIY